MAWGFNGDGFEDLVVAWLFFHIPLNQVKKFMHRFIFILMTAKGIYMRIYQSIIQVSLQHTHLPTGWLLLTTIMMAIDDVFAGSMGLQYRDPDYSNNYIGPYPRLILVILLVNFMMHQIALMIKMMVKE